MKRDPFFYLGILTAYLLNRGVDCFRLNNETHLPWPLIDFALDTSDNPGAFLGQAAVADWRTVIRTK